MDPTPGLIPAACRYSLFLQSLLRSAQGVSYQLIVFNVTLIDIRSMLLSSSQTRSQLWWGINYLCVTTLPLLLLHSDTCDGTTIRCICSISPSWMCHVLQIKESEQSHSILTDQSTPQECVLWRDSSRMSYFTVLLSFFIYFIFCPIFLNHKCRKLALLRFDLLQYHNGKSRL